MDGQVSWFLIRREYGVMADVLGNHVHYSCHICGHTMSFPRPLWGRPQYIFATLADHLQVAHGVTVADLYEWAGAAEGGDLGGERARC